MATEGGAAPVVGEPVAVSAGVVGGGDAVVVALACRAAEGTATSSGPGGTTTQSPVRGS
jgi:hypothetical protein